MTVHPVEAVREAAGTDLAHPDVTAEVGCTALALHARVLDDAERAPIWERQKSDDPGFAGYEAKTDRTIPVVLLEP